jgi:hypothetical protein
LKHLKIAIPKLRFVIIVRRALQELDAGKVDSSLMQKCVLVEVPKSDNLWNSDGAQVGYCDL